MSKTVILKLDQVVCTTDDHCLDMTGGKFTGTLNFDTHTPQISGVDIATTADVATKANSADVANDLALKANSTDVANDLALKANSADVANDLAAKANSADVANDLALKANSADVYSKSDTYTKSEVNSYVAANAPVTDLSNYYTRGEVDSAVSSGSFNASVSSPQNGDTLSYSNGQWVNVANSNTWTENNGSRNEIDGHWLANHYFLGNRGAAADSGTTLMPKVSYASYSGTAHVQNGNWGQMVSDGGYIYAGGQGSGNYDYGLIKIHSQSTAGAWTLTHGIQQYQNNYSADAESMVQNGNTYTPYKYAGYYTDGVSLVCCGGAYTNNSVDFTGGTYHAFWVSVNGGSFTKRRINSQTYMEDYMSAKFYSGTSNGTSFYSWQNATMQNKCGFSTHTVVSGSIPGGYRNTNSYRYCSADGANMFGSWLDNTSLTVKFFLAAFDSGSTTDWNDTASMGQMTYPTCTSDGAQAVVTGGTGTCLVSYASQSNTKISSNSIYVTTVPVGINHVSA